MRALSDLNPLKFPSADDEQSFFIFYCLDQLSLVRFSTLGFGGNVVYLFYMG